MGRCPYGDRLVLQKRAMHTTNQKLMLQGGLIHLGPLVVSCIGRMDEPGLTTAQLYDRSTNLRLGFRYLRDLLERYEGNADAKLRLALLAYNRGPGRVQELLDAGKDPQNGYAAALMKGYRRKS